MQIVSITKRADMRRKILMKPARQASLTVRLRARSNRARDCCNAITRAVDFSRRRLRAENHKPVGATMIG